MCENAGKEKRTNGRERFILFIIDNVVRYLLDFGRSIAIWSYDSWILDFGQLEKRCDQTKIVLLM